MKRKLMAAICVAAAVFAAKARNLVWTGDVGDSFTAPNKWSIQDTSTYSTTPPGPDDKIVIGIHKPITVDISDETNLGVVNGCLGICLAETTSKCYIVAPEGYDRSITVPIVGSYNTAKGDLSRGQLFVSGPGTVRLCATNMYSYAMSTMDIYGGAKVYLPQNQDLLLSLYRLGDIAISNSATLYLPARHNGSLNNGANYVQMDSLFGDGTMSALEVTELRFNGSRGVFSGVLDTNVRLFSHGRQMLTGTNSTMNRAAIVYNSYKKWATSNGVLGVMSLGKSGEASSVGTVGYFSINVHGGTYLYLGEGEEVTKYFRPYSATDGYNVIDAGAHGGLVFTGGGGVLNTEPSVSKPTANCIIGLSGSNTTACVFRGRFTESAANGTRYYLSTVVKKGTGTWRFADPALDGLNVPDYRNFRGSISVDEGVLQFDTIAPTGEYCSVGIASELKGPNLGVWTNLPNVDWAFSLGGTNAALNALAEGTLEYMGAKAGLCDRRRVRLEADGRFRANGPKKIRYRMAAKTSERAKTLSLDGASMATNEVRGIFDTAAHPVSIVKEGEGTWLLGGMSPLHGDLKVKGGKLIVENYPAGSQYTWFRFTVKNVFDPVSGSKGCVSVRFLGLYDANGRCHTVKTACAEDMRAAAVEPGEAGYDTTRKFTRGSYYTGHDHNPTNLFRTNPVFDLNPYSPTDSSGYYPRINNALTWVPMVVRLTNGAPEIASFDWSNTYGFTGGNKGGFQWTPNVWSLEGSVDGINWENVKLDGGDFSITTNDCPQLANGAYFIYSGLAQSQANFNTRNGNNAYYHTGGCAIRGTCTNSYVTLTDVRSVQVDGGATLEIEGTSGVTFDNLTVDASKGCGTITGGAFAADGTVEIENWQGHDAKSMGGDLTGAADAANISRWSVKVGGVERSRWHVKYSDGKLTVFPPGLRVSFR